MGGDSTLAEDAGDRRLTAWVYGALRPNENAYLDNGDGTEGNVDAISLGDDSAVTWTITKPGLYYIEITGNGCTPTSATTFTIEPEVSDGPVIVNELRLTGPSTSPGDQYVDLYNRSGAPLSLNGWTLDWTSGQSSGSAALDDVLLPAGGHYLVAGSAYSLSAAAVPDQTVALPASLDGVSLVEPDGSTVSDSVGYVGSGDVEGTGLTAPVYPAGNGSLVAFVRRYANGAPVDTGDNQADFVLVAADETANDTPSYGQPTSDPSVLGTPSPLDSGSPVQVNGSRSPTCWTRRLGRTPPPTWITRRRRAAR